MRYRVGDYILREFPSGSIDLVEITALGHYYVDTKTRFSLNAQGIAEVIGANPTWFHLEYGPPRPIWIQPCQRIRRGRTS
jgi:hypothetical protein